MPILLTSPADRIAAHLDPESMDQTDPYSLGFCADSYNNTGRSELARYAIGGGRTAFISYSLTSGFALVIHNSYGKEMFASKMDSPETIRFTVAPYIS